MGPGEITVEIQGGSRLPAMGAPPITRGLDTLPHAIWSSLPFLDEEIS